MKTALFVAHPGLHEAAYGSASRLNLALVEAVKKQPDVTIVDLSKDNNIEKHQKLMETSDRIVLQFPIFWFNMPALAKSWLDSVLAHGWAYGKQFKLEGKEWLCGVTSGQVVSNYSKTGSIGVTMEEFLVSMKVIANYCKMKYLPHFHVGGSLHISDQELSDAAKEYAHYITNSSLK